MTPSFIPKNTFPLPAPITPKLVALGLDDKIAATVSKVYLSVAHSLKETCETEYTRACDAFIATSDDRGYSSKELRSKLLTVMIARYAQALSKWIEEATQKAESSLRKKKKASPKIKVSSWPQFTSGTSANAPSRLKTPPSVSQVPRAVLNHPSNKKTCLPL